MRKRITLGKVGRAALHLITAAASLGQYHVRNRAVLRELRRKFLNFDDELLERALRRLEKRGLLSRTTSGSAVTDSGKLVAFSRGLGIEKVPIPEAWNGAWVVVAFDVPGDKSPERDVLRSCLRALGFEPSQKSVYVHPSPAAAGAFAKIAASLGAERRIILVTGGDIDGDSALRRVFGV